MLQLTSQGCDFCEEKDKKKTREPKVLKQRRIVLRLTLCLCKIRSFAYDSCLKKKKKDRIIV